MKKLAELDRDICQMLMEGSSPMSVAQTLKIPISWVMESKNFLDRKYNSQKNKG